MTNADELLATFFRDEHPSVGFEGDVEGRSPTETAVQFIRTLIAERDEARTALAGPDIGSLPHDWTLAQVVEARLDDIRKLQGQVRDTCVRAEKAEAALATAREEGRREGMEEAAALVASARADTPRHKVSAAIRQAARNSEGGGEPPASVVDSAGNTGWQIP